MTFTPTPEQETIVSAARDTTDNLLISALAGAAKTSTLILIAEALPKVEILCLAFNKRIAVEMQERLPTNCKAMTLNSLGHRAWMETISDRVTLAAGKNYDILRDLVDKLDAEDKKEAFERFSDILKAVGAGKTAGYVPDDPAFKKAKRLMDDQEFYEWLSEEPSDLEWSLIRQTSIISMKQALKGVIDFDDQILMPTVFFAFFPRYPLILVDEAQDLSALNHAMLRKLVRKRLIAVGDECQSIYGFRGAHEDSMKLIKKEFNMTELHLTISFRCPTSVVEEARWRAPFMQWPEWAKPGSVRTLTEWSVEDLPEEATIICRNNAPIFNMAIKLLRNGRYPQLVGIDIGKTLLKHMKKLGKATIPQPEVMERIAAWQEAKEKKARNRGPVRDQAECMRIFARQGKDLGEAIAYAEHLLQRHGPIQLMTGHKSKGLEFDNVFILDKDLVRMGEPQDRNLMYVMQTRAKDTLTYITSENFEDNSDAED